MYRVKARKEEETDASQAVSEEKVRKVPDHREKRTGAGHLLQS